MYKAVEESLNVPAVWLLNQIGLDKGLAALQRFGIPVQKEDKNLAIALGGMSKGISPLQLANAFSTFPNGGKREDSHLITKIVGPTGNIIAEHKEKTTKVTSKSVTNKMTSMLLNVVETGTGKSAHINGVQIAGKTGSTQLPFSGLDGTKDQWMAGYTSDLVGAVWIGYDQTDQEHYLPSSSSANVVPIFRDIMQAGIPYVKHANFEVDSINTQLANKNQTQKVIQEQAAKFSQQFQENAKKFGQTIQEQAPTWKEGINQTLHTLGRSVDTLIQKLQGLSH
jgi:penicillin-binding protein 2A